jgi:hypothetical protein
MVHLITSQLYHQVVWYGQQFHNYFFSSIHEIKITDLTRLEQRNDETIVGFAQRFKEVKNKC